MVVEVVEVVEGAFVVEAPWLKEPVCGPSFEDVYFTAIKALRLKE